MKIGLIFLFFVIFSIFCVNYCEGEENGFCDGIIYYLCDSSNTLSSFKCRSGGSEVCCQVRPIKHPNMTTLIDRSTIQKTENPKSSLGSNNSCECVPTAECQEVSGTDQLDLRIMKSCPSDQVCCPTRDAGVEGGGDHNDFQECGVRRPLDQQFTSFRIAGKPEKSETFFGEFPWMLAILKLRINNDGSTTENVFQCGAGLILPNVVLTSAHCVTNISIDDIKVRAGEWNTVTFNDTQREQFPYIEKPVREILIHDKFDHPSLFNDIALLILDSDFPIKDHIGLICTPNFAEKYDPDDCLVTGWGKEKFGKEGRYSQILRKVDLKIVPCDSCQKKLRDTRLGPLFELHESFICASGGPNQDACKGDGGGPLVCRMKEDRQRYTQVGIVSWGIGCGSDTPGVYVDVLRFKKWILENSHGNNFDVIRIKSES